MLRIIIADDERPAREYLKTMLAEFGDVRLIGEAGDGAEALELIKREKPDLALLDLQMPELSGLDIVSMLRRSQMPLVAFITAFDEHAIRAFELNAIDYLLKPVEKNRLRTTLDRAGERLEAGDWRDTHSQQIKNAAGFYAQDAGDGLIERIPVRIREDIRLIAVAKIASIVADGELLKITTIDNQKYVINYRLKDIENRLDDRQFVRLSRGTLVNIDQIDHMSPSTAGTFIIVLKNGQKVTSSRHQSKILRSRLLRL
ncbi:MAG: LytR/AlgR family response regulator transcription factor [Pyrinomonadaceae bacterium]